MENTGAIIKPVSPWETLSTKATEAVKAVKPGCEKLVASTKETFSNLSKKQVAGLVVGTAAVITGSLIYAGVIDVSPLTNGAKELAQPYYGPVLEAATPYYNSAAETVSGLYNSTSESVTYAYNNPGEAASGLYNSTSHTVSGLYNSTSESVTYAYNNPGEAASSLYSKAAGTASSMYSKAVDAAGKAWTSFEELLGYDTCRAVEVFDYQARMPKFGPLTFEQHLDQTTARVARAIRGMIPTEPTFGGFLGGGGCGISPIPEGFYDNVPSFEF